MWARIKFLLTFTLWKHFNIYYVTLSVPDIINSHSVIWDKIWVWTPFIVQAFIDQIKKLYMFHAIRQFSIYTHTHTVRYSAILTCLCSVVSNSSAGGGIYMVTFIDPWNLEFNLSNILCSYLTESSPTSTSRSLLHRKRLLLLWKWYKKTCDCVQNLRFSVIKTGGAYSDHCALSG